MSYKVWEQIDEVILDLEVLEIFFEVESVKFRIRLKHKDSGTTLRDKTFLMKIGDYITMTELMVDEVEDTFYNKITYKQEVI